MKDQNTADLTSNLHLRNDAVNIILDNLEDSFILADLSLTITLCNRSAAQELGALMQLPLTAGTSLTQLRHKSKALYSTVLLKKALAGEVSCIETETSSPDGESIYFNHTIKPALDARQQIIGVIIHCKNVTGSKKAELQLKEAEERWQFALQATNQGAWDWNMQTDEVIYSDSYKKMYGFTDADLKNHLSEWQSRIHPEDRKRIEENIKEHTAADNPYHETTYRIQLKSGEYKWIMARGKLLSKDISGRPLRMIGTHTDITQTKRTEEILQTMNERFAFAARATSQALWEWDAVSGEAYVSPSFTEIFGWQADSNQHFEQWHQYLHPQDKEQTIDGYYNLLKDASAKIWQAEYRFLKADGSYAIVSDKAYIIRDAQGQAVKVIGATQDISQQKKIEEELSKSNERYNNMLKATNELLWEWDIKTDHIFRAREGLRKVYGIEDDSDISTIKEWLSRIHPDDSEKLMAVLAGLLQSTDYQTFEVEYRFQKDDATYAFIYDRGILLKDDNGIPLRMIGAAQDISQRKRLESELLQNELEYKKLINQATVDSQEQERGEIGKELHDNINQVLTTTKLYLEFAHANPDMVSELLKKSSRNISTVINEIRQLSRSLMDPSLGDLGIIDSINDLIENINLTRKIRITFKADEAVEDLLDKKQKLTVFRIIQESLNNVIRHAKAKLVEISIIHNNNSIAILVADNGIGLKESSVKKGAGLKNITNRVYLINGTFELHSQPGQGCQIKISFPINQQEKH